MEYYLGEKDNKGLNNMDTSIFHDLIQKYGQQTNLDPQQLQVGQQVYTPEGTAMTVIEDPSDTTSKTLMPSDQQGQQLPKGVTTVEDNELASQYSLQPPNGTQPAPGAQGATVAKRAQEEDPEELGEVNWNDIADIVNDMSTAVKNKDMRWVMECMEDMTGVVLMNINMPSDLKVASVFEEYIEEI